MVKTFRRAACVLLALATLLVMLPMTAFAAGTTPTVISSINITGLDTPVHNKVPDTEVSVAENGIEVAGVYWQTASGSSMTTPFFEAGKKYASIIQLSLKNNFVLPQTAPTVKINGSPAADVSVFENRVYVKAEFTAAEAVIRSIDISGNIAPVNGLKPINTRVSVATEGCELYTVVWYKDGTQINSDSVFETNANYRIAITVNLKNGYKPASGMTAKINGAAAEISKNSDTQYVISKSFKATDKFIIDRLNIEVDAPVNGAAPNSALMFSVMGCTLVSNQSAFWYDEQKMAPMTANSTFIAGNKYTFTASIKPSNAAVYEFAPADGFSATVNNTPATVTVGNDTTSEYIIKCTFTAAKDVIDRVVVTDVVVPAAGNTCSDKMTISPDTCLVQIVQWRDQAKNKIMGANETFTKGNKYELIAYLVPERGCEFAAVNKMSITVNGTAVAANNILTSNILPASRGFKVEFTATDANISAIDVTEAVSPVEGKKPVSTVKLPENCTLLKTEWIDEESSQPLGADSVFVVGKKYKLVVTAAPKNSTDAFAANDKLKATVNGEAAVVGTVENNAAARTVSYSFTAAPAIVVSYYPNGGTGAPEAQAKVKGTALTLSTVVPTREGYTFNGWNDKADGTGVAYTPGGTYTADVSVTLYAQWKENITAPVAPTINRLYGADRVVTATKISSAAFTSANSVVIASGKVYADALAAAPLAYSINAPILLVYGDTLGTELKTELTRLAPKYIYIVGGAAAVSDTVKTQLQSYVSDKKNVYRIAGQDRFKTSVDVAANLKAVCGSPSEIFLAYAVDYPDALAISPVAAMNKSPILYADKSGKLDPTVENFIKTSGCTKVTILGGTANIPDSVKTSLTNAGVAQINRIGGADRFDTMLKINTAYASKFTGKGVCVATGLDFPDALAGSVFAAKKAMPIVLVPKTITSGDSIDKYVADKKPEVINIFGGENAVSKAVADELAK